MTSVPQLSVIVPNFNHGKVLPRAVGAHLGGARGSREIIVVDDASSDDSVEVATRLCERHADVRLIRRSERGGPNAAIRTGLAQARGGYVTFAAADDVVEPGFAESAIETLERFPRAAFCFFDPSSLYANSGRTVRVPLALAPAPAYFSPDALEAMFRRNYFTISSNTVVYRRAAIEELGGFRPDLAWHADWMANLVLAFRHGACYRPEAKAHFLVDPHSYSGEGTRSAGWQRELLFECLDALEHDYPDVRARFKSAALIPEMRARDLVWLAVDRRGRAMLTWRLAARLVAREAWTMLRPLAPQGLRRAMRRLAAASVAGG